MKFKMIENFDLYDYNDIDIEPGLYFLVTANGFGKSTFMRNIRHAGGASELHKSLIGRWTVDHIEDCEFVYYFYDAERQNTKTRAWANEEVETSDMVQALFINSEGQNRYKSFVDVAEAIGVAVDVNIKKNKPVVIMIDAVDSGLDIAYCKMLKEFFVDVLKKDIMGKEIYVFIAANQFALIKECLCLDVNNGNKISFKEYEEFDKFIMEKAETQKNKEKKRRVNRRGSSKTDV